ncbi:SH3 domain-containing protein [Szabonella alba]|uniref:SH3 domain-containing protein n=1 Tax=Szabonella alba TaxID=2804194 RepID=A0A8K0VCT3_9RHOB|nr:SH3 domain-containing protein [Szabonella alba]MBL4917495.1 SH3 domain-containing protein [Szabonella alba]
MDRTIKAAMLAALVTGGAAALPAGAASPGWYEVYGVSDDDMLKMRAGPGTGFNIILGLPNGTALRVHRCEQTGSTRWCEVSLERARGLRGYVSAAYIRERDRR